MAVARASMIVAMTPKRVIGTGNKLPWHLPADLKFFRDTTRGHAVIMGRKTFESIGRALPERVNIVVSAAGFAAPEGVTVVSSLEAAWRAVQERAPGDVEPFVLGGARLYAEALRADGLARGPLQGFLGRVYVTLVEATLEGDAWFPELDASWRRTKDEPRAADEKNAYAMRFQVYEKHS